MWKPKWWKNWRNYTELRKYLDRLTYALKKLGKPYHNDIADEDRVYRQEIVHWLYLYYRGEPEFVGEGTPKIKLAKILAKSSCDATKRDHVHVKILVHWNEYKRIEGF